MYIKYNYSLSLSFLTIFGLDEKKEESKKSRRYRIATDREAVRAGRSRSEENECEGKKQE